MNRYKPGTILHGLAWAEWMEDQGRSRELSGHKIEDIMPPIEPVATALAEWLEPFAPDADPDDREHWFLGSGGGSGERRPAGFPSGEFSYDGGDIWCPVLPAYHGQSAGFAVTEEEE